MAPPKEAEMKVARRMVLAVAAGLLFSVGGAAKPKATGSIVVTGTGFNNDQGKMIVVIFNKKDGFPMDLAKGYSVRDTKIKNGKGTVVFKNVPKGTYAGALFHDKNNNRKIDTNWIGIPKEGVAATNNAEGTLGPPKWKDAKFDVAKGKVVQKLNVLYL